MLNKKNYNKLLKDYNKLSKENSKLRRNKKGTHPLLKACGVLSIIIVIFYLFVMFYDETDEDMEIDWKMLVDTD